MGWEPSLFDAFVDDTVKMANGELPGYGYPHVIVPYAAVDEVRCIERLREMPTVLHARGLTSSLVPVARVVADVMRRYAENALADAAAGVRLESDLGNATEGLAQRVAKRIHKQLTPGVQVLVLGRLGALHPFGTVSGLLDALYNTGVRATVAAAYPGSAEGVSLRFLGITEPHGGYRGHIVTHP